MAGSVKPSGIPRQQSTGWRSTTPHPDGVSTFLPPTSDQVGALSISGLPRPRTGSGAASASQTTTTLSRLDDSLLTPTAESTFLVKSAPGGVEPAGLEPATFRMQTERSP